MRLVVAFAVILCLSVGLNVVQFLSHGTPQIVYAGGTPSGNGDVNASGAIDIADAIYLLTYLFAKGPEPEAIENAGGGLPATGQTQCYDIGGNVDCASLDWPGQDGFYGKGCPTADRYVDNQDETVTDNCTGLMWKKATADADGNGAINESDVMPWQQALQYCENLEFAGHSDWRLPNVRELQSIVDYGRSFPSSDPILGAESGWYWSSSTVVGFPSIAWFVSFYDGFVGSGSKGNGIYYVRAVRG